MNLNEYQTASARTMRTDMDEMTALAVLGLGLTGEAGEVAEVIKKHVGHGHELDHEAVTKELGDVLWYVAAIATTLDIDLATVAAVNIAKLRARYPDGFDSEASRNRVDRF